MLDGITSGSRPFGHWKLSRNEAIDLLDSPDGIALHEVGHHAAANAENLIIGHIVVERSETCPRGAFVISDALCPPQPTPQQLGFTFAAGAMAELTFSGITNPFRLLSDIRAFTGLLDESSPRMNSAALIGLWSELYKAKFEDISDAVEQNFRRCQAILRSSAYRIAGYDVIPSHLLLSKNRNRRDYDQEVVFTEPLDRRVRAIERYIVDRGRP
jgi:hypothetical protein